MFGLKTHREHPDISSRAVQDALDKKDGRAFASEGETDYRKKTSELIEAHYAKEEKLKTEIDQFQPFADTALGIVLAAKAKLNGIVVKTKTDIEIAKGNFEEAVAHFRSFKTQYKIKRLPHSPNKLMAIAVMVSLGLLEGSANTVFFLASGSMPNIIEAAKLGFFFAYTNIIVAAVGGGFLSFRYLHPSCTNIQRRLAALGSIMTVTSVTLIVYATALVRSTGEFNGLMALYGSPSLIFDDLYSIMLLAIGGVVSVFAGYKGMTSFDESIPGYALVNRHVQETKDAAGSAFNTGHDELIEAYDDANSKLKENGVKLASHRNDLINKVAELNASGKTIKDKCTGHYDVLLKDMNSYCQEWVSIRPNLKVLDKQFTPIEVPEFKAFDCKSIGIKFNAVQAKLASMHNKLDEAMTEAQKQVDDAMFSFNKLV